MTEAGKLTEVRPKESRAEAKHERTFFCAHTVMSQCHVIRSHLRARQCPQHFFRLVRVSSWSLSNPILPTMCFSGAGTCRQQSLVINSNIQPEEKKLLGDVCLLPEFLRHHKACTSKTSSTSTPWIKCGEWNYDRRQVGIMCVARGCHFPAEWC